MEHKLIVVIMGPGKRQFAEMCLDSVKDADKILYWSNNKGFIFKYSESGFYKNKIFNNGWDETDPATNGKCRNRYLEHLKKNYPNDWCLVLDEDEVVEDLSKIKEFINQKDRKPGIYNVKMRHLIGDLGHEDATKLVHVVPRRLFKISEAKKYPLQSHPVLNVTKTELGETMGACLDTTIWHLGHLPVLYLDYILKRYKQHANDSVMHSLVFLNQWKINHLFGHYPSKEINPMELPKQLCDRYEIDKDEFYFQPRKQIEVKHFVMMSEWLKYSKANSILDIGCGFGLFGLAGKMINENLKYKGVEISKYVGDNWNTNIGDLINEDIKNVSINEPFDLVLFIDILEHLSYEDLDIVLKKEQNKDSKFIFSIPFLGDPNLDADSTHIIKEDKEWWIGKLSKYFAIREAPKDWLFSNQLLIGEKK